MIDRVNSNLDRLLPERLVVVGILGFCFWYFFVTLLNEEDELKRLFGIYSYGSILQCRDELI